MIDNSIVEEKEDIIDSPFNYGNSEFDDMMLSTRNQKVVDIDSDTSFQEVKEKNIVSELQGNEAKNTKKSNNAIDNKFSKPSVKQIVLSNYTEFSDEELAKYASIILKEQKGCMFLQAKINKNKKFSKMVYINIKNKIIDLMFGGFSNYLVQKLLENVSKKILKEILSQIFSTQSFTVLGLDPHGTRVLQTLLENIASYPQLVSSFTNGLMQNINKFIFDPNANHIIIKYCSVIPPSQNQIIYDYFKTNIIQVCQNKNSCCALQKCIQLASVDQKNMLFKVISLKSKYLINDDFGNYVIQFIIPFCSKSDLDLIIDEFIPNIDTLSIEKSASNVIEKCLEYCDSESRERIISKYLNEKAIKNLLSNKYGNYVLQTLLNKASGTSLSVLIKLIKANKNLIDDNINKKLASKIQKNLSKKDKSKEQSKFINSNIFSLSQNNENRSSTMSSKFKKKQSCMNQNTYYKNFQGPNLFTNPNVRNFAGRNFPMNINIAINNYYTNPVYNYYCLQNTNSNFKQNPPNGC